MPTRARLDKRYRGVTAMMAAGLDLSWHGDDPAMFDTNPGESWARRDDAEKCETRAAFRTEFTSLRPSVPGL